MSNNIQLFGISTRLLKIHITQVLNEAEKLLGHIADISTNGGSLKCILVLKKYN